MNTLSTPSPKISIQEMMERKKTQATVDAIFAVDNLYRNQETQYIFDDYHNGIHATIGDAIEALDKHYGITR